MATIATAEEELKNFNKVIEMLLGGQDPISHSQTLKMIWTFVVNGVMVIKW